MQLIAECWTIFRRNLNTMTVQFYTHDNNNWRNDEPSNSEVDIRSFASHHRQIFSPVIKTWNKSNNKKLF